MALSKENVKRAWYILNEINPKANNSWIQDYEKDDDGVILNTILGCDRKYDDGWENVLMYIKDITPEQEAIFERRKKEVHNSSFKRDEGDGITCLGWF